jgi:putative component of toxin-antitoxin plasmid stabilization module
MAKFALKEISEITGKVKFFKLLNENVCEFDTFWNEILNEGNLKSELNTIQARMQLVSDLKSMPKEKFKDITPAGDAIKEYEIKTPNLRVYIFHEHLKGRIVVCGGKKGSQASDIKHFRNIKKEYFKSLNARRK